MKLVLRVHRDRLACVYVHVFVVGRFGLGLLDQPLDRLLEISGLLLPILFLFLLLLLLQFQLVVTGRHAFLWLVAVVLKLLVLLFVRHQGREGIHSRSKSIVAFVVFRVRVLQGGDSVAGFRLASLGILDILLTIRQYLADLRLKHQFRILARPFGRLLKVRDVVWLALLPLIAEILLLFQGHRLADRIRGAVDLLGAISILPLI